MGAVTEPRRGAPITGLSHFQLLVSDVGASGRWYATVLGLLPFSEDPDLGYVALTQREARFVVVLTKGPGPGPNDESANDGLDHLAFAVPDGDSLRAWAEHLTEAGIDHSGVVLEDGRLSLQLRDPDGMAIELVAP